MIGGSEVENQNEMMLVEVFEVEVEVFRKVRVRLINMLSANRDLDCKTVVYFAYVRHTSARASARSSNGSRKVSECKIRPLRELDAKIIILASSSLRGLILHSLTSRLPFENRALARALV